MTKSEPQIITEACCDVCRSKDVVCYNTAPQAGKDYKVRHYYCHVCPRDYEGKRHTFKVIVK